MTITELKNELRKFGLSDNQADVYLHLARHGELRVQEIASALGIPRSSLYEHLRALSKLGLIEEILEDNFKKIKAYPVSNLRHDLEKKILSFQQLNSGLDNLTKELSEFAENGPAPAMTVRYYKGVSGARQLLWNTLKTTGTVYVYSEWGRSSHVGPKFYENFVAESRKRNIQEKVLINPSKSTLDSTRKFSNSTESRTSIEDIRVLDKKQVRIIGETFIYNGVYSQVYLKNGEINGFEIQSNDFVNTQTSIFKVLWSQAGLVRDS